MGYDLDAINERLAGTVVGSQADIVEAIGKRGCVQRAEGAGDRRVAGLNRGPRGGKSTGAIVECVGQKSGALSHT